jgi:recombinational DNA repair protein (RecF pathway)
VSAETQGPECCLCGRRVDLVADENVEGLFTCRTCLERVASQNARIREGLEDEPEAEL